MAEIKKLSANRWRDYRSLRLEALKNDPTAFGSSYKEEIKLTEKEWKRRMKNTLFALSDNKMIGMIVYVFQKKTKIRHISNIFGVYVKKEFRNKGVGKNLIESALSSIKKNRNIIKINLNVNSKQKAALKLYKKYGFKVVGTLKKDLNINGKFYDELIMEKFV